LFWILIFISTPRVLYFRESSPYYEASSGQSQLGRFQFFLGRQRTKPVFSFPCFLFVRCQIRPVLFRPDGQPTEDPPDQAAAPANVGEKQCLSGVRLTVHFCCRPRGHLFKTHWFFGWFFRKVNSALTRLSSSDLISFLP